MSLRQAPEDVKEVKPVSGD